MIWRDLKYALRILWQRPAYATVAVLSLALGIGACTAIFSVVDAVLWRSLPFPQAERIISVREVDAKGRQITFAHPNFLDLRARNKPRSGSRSWAAASRFRRAGLMYRRTFSKCWARGQISGERFFPKRTGPAPIRSP